MNGPSESVILCEGYHDRAFWAGWLEHLGCTDPGTPVPPVTRRRDIIDPFKTKVVTGHFAYFTKTGQFLRIRPCNGRTNIIPAARVRIEEHPTKTLNSLVVNLDSDVNADGSPSVSSAMRLPDLESALQRLNLAIESKSDNTLILQGGVRIFLIRWDASDPHSAHLPNQQTLERLVCAAISAAYPDRGSAIAAWLTSRQNPPAFGPKEFAWSHMAGWFSEHGCDDFYRNVWRDPLIRAELQTRLRTNGAWQIVESLVA